MVVKDVQEIPMSFDTATEAHVQFMAHGRVGRHGVTVAKRVARDHVFETGLAVIHHLDMVAEIVLEIFLKTDNVILVHAMSMLVGQHGPLGVTVARHVTAEQDLAKDVVVIHHSYMVVETA